MNKAELVAKIADRAGEGINKKLVDQVLTQTLDVIMETVANGDKVTLIGFGSFEAKKRSARTGHNPKTGEPLNIPATIVPAFSAGKIFKDKVSGKEAN